MLLRLILLVALSKTAYGGIMMSPAMGGPRELVLTRATRPVPLEQQLALNELCARMCHVEKCYLKDDQDCANYIFCERGPKGNRYRGIVQPCAFGAYWAGLALQQKITCDLPSNVVCNNNKCAGMPLGHRYAYDWNCKGFWECGPKGPEPKCCSDDMYFDAAAGDCVVAVNRYCNDRCPIKTDACLALGTPTAEFPDGNCRSYWDCEDRRPHPVCCPEGHAYNDAIKGCEPNPSCTSECRYTDACLRQSTYKLYNDSMCRTYIKCNAIAGDERWCCPSGEFYDDTDNTCKPVPETATLDCTDECPQNYSIVCPLEVFPGDPSKYIQKVHGVPTTMHCAPGAHFSEAVCGCGMIVKGAADNSCNMELDIVFDPVGWIRSGSQRNTSIEEIGVPLPGKILNNRMSTLFDGQLYYRANFFQQSLPMLYLHLIFLPGATTANDKQSLVSNCAMLEGGTPSLELALSNNQVVLSLVASSLTNPNVENLPVIVAVDYTPDDWNQVTVVYDGERVMLFNQSPVTSPFATQALSGDIKVATEGLDFGGCMNLVSMFRGSVSKLQISKCLKQSWVDAFNESTREYRTTPV